MTPDHLAALIRGEGPKLQKAGTSFLLKLWDYDPAAYTFLCTRRAGTDRWREHPITGPRKPQIKEVLDRYPAENHDIYFCPNAFSKPRRLARYATLTRYAWCDIDDAKPRKFSPKPNILWETSPRRYQGIWIWKANSAGGVAEQYSRNLWRLNGGDAGGWSVTKALRLPGTINHKPAYQRPRVRLVSYDAEAQVIPDKIADVLSVMPSFTSPIATKTPHDPRAVMRRYRRAMGLPAGALMAASRVLIRDRSAAVFLIVAALAKAGASDDEIVSVLLVNPYFVGKWGIAPDEAYQQISLIRERAVAQ